MRIALLGTRGIPASYGGFETFAEELSIRLAERGHRVTVYCRAKHTQREYRGVQLRYLPSLRHKYLDTVAHTAISTLDVLFRRFDVILYCNAANAVFTLWPRLIGTPTALNVDGLERYRKKWNAGKMWYLASEWMATWCCSAVVTDAETIRDYYLRALWQVVPVHPLRRGGWQGRRNGFRRGTWVGAGAIRAVCEPHGTGEQRAHGSTGVREGRTPVLSSYW